MVKTPRPRLTAPIIRKPVRREDFKGTKPKVPGVETGKEPENFRLADVLAAIRREFEAAGINAEADEDDIPKFYLAEAEIEFAYAVTDLTDENGLEIVFVDKKLANIPKERLQRLKVKLIDAEALAMEFEAKSSEKSL